MVVTAVVMAAASRVICTDLQRHKKTALCKESRFFLD